MTKRRVHAEPIPRWHPAEEAQMIAQYAHMPTRLIALMLESTRARVYNKAFALGLKKSPEYLSGPEAGRIHGGYTPGAKRNQFKPGHVTWNKGKHYHAGGRCRETQFKKGVRQGVAVKLWKPIGTERITKDGYLSRKVNDGMPLQRRWRLVHLILWEAAHGPIPKGYAVCFTNGDRREVRLENLSLISRADLMRRNTVHNLPKPLAQIVQLRGALLRQINKREHGKQDRGSEGTPVRNARGATRSRQADGDRPSEGGRGRGEGDRG